MIGDHLGLSFLDNLREGTAAGSKQSYGSGQEDEQGYFFEGIGFVGRQQASSNRIDDQLHQLKGDQGEQALDEDEPEIGDRPTWGALPDQAHGPLQVETVSDPLFKALSWLHD
jgi:hypothetical protein